jgi:hypothetical protein
MSRRHFGPQHLTNNYGEMGGALGRPKYAGIKSRSIQEAIAAARRTAAREAAAKKGK